MSDKAREMYIRCTGYAPSSPGEWTDAEHMVDYEEIEKERDLLLAIRDAATAERDSRMGSSGDMLDALDAYDKAMK